MEQIKSPTPPTLALRLLNLSIPLHIREHLIGDLVEEFSQVKIPAEGTTKSNLWFWKQTILSSYEYLNKQRGGIMSFVLSIMIFLGLVFIAMLLGGEVSMYLDVPFLFVICVTSLAFGISATSRKTGKFAIKLLISEQDCSDTIAVKQAAHFLRVTGNTALLMGGLIAMIVLTATAQHLFQETMAKALQPGISLFCLAFLYASILKILCYVGEQRVANALITAEIKS